MSTVLVVVESFNNGFKKAALEAVSYGRLTAQLHQVSCTTLVLGQADQATSLGNYGADKVILASGKVVPADNKQLTSFIADMASAQGAVAIIMPTNSTTKAIIGRLAVRLKSGCATNVNSIPILDGTNYLLERSVFSGKAKATLLVNGPVKIIGLASGVIPLFTEGKETSVETVEINGSTSLEVIETKRVSGKTPLPEAELVVSAGRGLKDPANWGIVEDLAEALGATTACSRPVADAGWRPHHEHVGQTGIAIKPNLYIALGISGAIQHLAGVNNSKVIVVINKDPEAPFFKAADYGIVGDVFEVVPRLTAAIKKMKAH